MKDYILKSARWIVLFAPLIPVYFLFFLETGCGEYCQPTCREGYTCVTQECVSVCNPECESGFTCNTDTLECEEEEVSTDTAAEDTSTDTSTDTATSISAEFSFIEDENVESVNELETEGVEEENENAIAEDFVEEIIDDGEE